MTTFGINHRYLFPMADLFLSRIGIFIDWSLFMDKTLRPEDSDLSINLQEETQDYVMLCKLRLMLSCSMLHYSSIASTFC